ncbi:thioredoxin-dependent thiol peroxidase [Proteus mirabilis]|uniref:Thioredoxin-dependent thiol peroxidase n=1 Tax=Proteus mirabilis TaxID=584 RepID=A0A2X2BLA3_PROMI|nr:thioredoxin-dependent thiol peroxidase [Proteus mirabilis]
MKIIKLQSNLAFGVKNNLWGKTYDGIHRTTFLIDKNGVIEHVFDNFKTSNHHQVVIDYLAAHP